MNGYIPALSRMPKNPATNKEQFQQQMLLLFKPFTCYEDLYDGISWDTSYESFYNVTEFVKYVDNVSEMHKGLDEKEEN